MALFATKPKQAAAPSPAGRDSARAELFAAGDRLLAARREAIEATEGFHRARDAAIDAIATYRDQCTAAGTGEWYTAASQLPGWPTLDAGEKFLARELSGAAALRYALLDLDRADANWRTAGALPRP